MPPKGSKKTGGTKSDGNSLAAKARQAVKKTKKKVEEAKPTRPKVLEREAKKQAKKDKAQEKKAQATADYEAGIRSNARGLSQRESAREKNMNRAKDRTLKEDRFSDDE